MRGPRLRGFSVQRRVQQQAPAGGARRRTVGRQAPAAPAVMPTPEELAVPEPPATPERAGAEPKGAAVSPAESINALDLAHGPRTPKPPSSARSPRSPRRLPTPQKPPHGRLPPLERGGASRPQPTLKSTVRQLVQDTFEWPADDVAQRHEDKVLPRTKEGAPIPCCCGPVDVEYMGLLGGVGLRLYFEFLRACALLFTAMALLSLPALLWNYHGVGLAEESPGFLAKTTHGNLLLEMADSPWLPCKSFDDIECCEAATAAAVGAAAGGFVSPGCGAQLQRLYYALSCTANWTQPLPGPNRSAAVYADLCPSFCDGLVSSCGALPLFSFDALDVNTSRHPPLAGSGEGNVSVLWSAAVASVGDNGSMAEYGPAHRQCFAAAAGALSAAASRAEALGSSGPQPGSLGQGRQPPALYVGWRSASCLGADWRWAEPESQRDVQVCALLDGLSALVMLAWYVWVWRRLSWIIKDQDSDMISMSDYTVQVVCRTIPEDLRPGELALWMEERFGTVVLLEMCLDNDETIELFKQKAALVEQRSRITARRWQAGDEGAFTGPVLAESRSWRRCPPFAKRLDTDLDTAIAIKDDEIQEDSRRRQPAASLPAGVEPYKTISAFVTFETDESFELALKWEKIAKYRRAMDDGGLGGRHIRDGYDVHLAEAPEPDTVIWENLEYSSAYRRRQRAKVTLVVILVLLLSFGGIIIASAYTTSISYLKDCPAVLNETAVHSPSGLEHPACGLVNVSVAGGTRVQPSLDVFAGCFEEERSRVDSVSADCSDRSKYATMQRYREDTNVHSLCYQCLCNGGSPAVGEFEDLAGLPSGSYCTSWNSFTLRIQIATLIGTLIVVIVNQALKMMLEKMVAYEKPHTLGHQQSSLAVKLFVAQLFNTAVLVLIINADKRSLGLLGGVIDPMRPPGVYFDDFSNKWFNNVGAAIIQAMVVQNITPPMAQMGLGLVERCLLRRKRRATRRAATGESAGLCGCCDGEPAYTAEELRQSVEAPQFRIASSYAEAFLLIFVSVMYGGGLPLLYPLAVVGFVAKFYADKWAILRVYRDPPMFGPQFASMTLNVLPFAFIFHCILSIWVFGRRAVVNVSWAADSGALLSWIGRAVADGSTIPLTIVLAASMLALATYWVMYFLLLHTETECEKRLKARQERRRAEADEREGQDPDLVPDFSTALRKGLFVDGVHTLTSYAIQDNPEYAAAFAHLKPQKERGQYQRIMKGVSGKELSIVGSEQASMPAAPWLRRWVILTKRLVEAKGAAYDAALEKKKSVARWRKQNPPVARRGQAVMSRRMWLHQVHDDGPLDPSGLPLHQAWAAYRQGEGDLPLMSAGDVYSAGEATERELHEMQKEAGPGGSGPSYTLRRRPTHSVMRKPRYPSGVAVRSESWRRAARQMEARAEDAQFGHMVEKIERCAKCIARKEECARCRKCAGGKPVCKACKARMRLVHRCVASETGGCTSEMVQRHGWAGKVGWPNADFAGEHDAAMRPYRGQLVKPFG